MWTEENRVDRYPLNVTRRSFRIKDEQLELRMSFSLLVNQIEFRGDIFKLYLISYVFSFARTNDDNRRSTLSHQ